jgi:hypothetical protein
MKMKLCFSIAFFVLAALVYAQNTDAPDWINNPVSIENGVVLFVGYSRARGTRHMTLQLAQSNAQTNLIRRIQDDELPELPPIPVDAKSRSGFSNITSKGKLEGTISDISMLDVWESDNGGFYVLCSCTGIELKQNEPQKKSLEEMDPIELYLHSLELEKQVTGEESPPSPLSEN